MTKLRQALAQEEKPPVKTYCGGKPNYCTPVDAVNMSQERVDETAKCEHDLVGACVTCGAPHGFWLSAPPTDFISPSVIKAIPKREWVGLTDEEIWDCYSSQGNLFYKAIEAKLKEKNSGS